jgi:phenylacetate-CoA ligase
VVETFKHRPFAARHFRTIVDHAWKHNPFYREWIADPERPPLLDRATALEHNDAILNGSPVTGTTSGSIGVPFRYSHSPEWVARANRDVVRFVRSIGGPLPTVKILHSSAIGADRTGGGRSADGQQPEARRVTDPMVIPVTTPVQDQIQFILRHKDESGTVAITTLPTNAELLASAILEQGLDMSFIRRFGTYAETLEPHQKTLLQTAFPEARLWSTYSSMEFGMIASMCPHEPDYFHIMAHRLGVEVLTADGSPAPDGEAGYVYVTDYFNRRSPLIRYELGDMAVRGSCPCGRTRLPALSRVLGRVSGTIVNRNGERVLFSELSIALREIPGVRQYQVIQEGIEEFEVKVSSSRRIDSEIREVFAIHLGYVPTQLTTHYLDSIPREANGKYRTSICRIQ